MPQRRVDAPIMGPTREVLRIQSVGSAFIDARFDVVPNLSRRVDSRVLRMVAAAVKRGSSLEINYMSMNDGRPNPLWRRMSPHSFGYDGARWFVRAYCHLDCKFKDFVLCRCLGARAASGDFPVTMPDSNWDTKVRVVLATNSKLSLNQKRATTIEFGLKKGHRSVFVRRAMLGYFKRQLSLNAKKAARSAMQMPLVSANRVDIDEEIKVAKL